MERATNSRVSVTHLAKFAAATVFSLSADRIALLFVLSLIVMAGPSGEGAHTGSLELLLPLCLFSFGAGAIADKIGGRNTMILAALISCALTFLTPTLMVMTAANRIAVGAMVSGLSLVAMLFSVGRFVLIPRISGALALTRTNSIVVVSTSLATLIAVYAYALIASVSEPAFALKFCCVLSLLGAVVARLLPTSFSNSQKPKVSDSKPAADATASGGIAGSIVTYLRKHRAAASILRLATCLYFIFSFWQTLMLCLVLENAQPGGVNLGGLFEFAFAGCSIGALMAPQASRIGRPFTIICAAMIGMMLSSLICVAAGSLTTVKYALGIAGVNCGLAFVVLDSLIQRIFPAKIRGAVAGSITSVVSIVMLAAMLIIEQRFEKSSMVIIFRLLGAAQLGLSLLLLLSWPRFARFTFQMFVWPFLSRNRRIRGDSPHHFTNTRAAVFLCQTMPWQDAATLCGMFQTPTRFLATTKRLRPLDRATFAAMGGVVAENAGQAKVIMKELNRTGYNVLFLGDDYTDAKNEITSFLVSYFAERNVHIVPAALMSDDIVQGGKLFKCGVPFSNTRRITPKKLMDEMKNIQRVVAPQSETRKTGNKD